MFVLDFDDTLFDTHQYKQARQEALLAVGVDAETFWHSYAEARKTPDGLFAYSNERHAQILARRGFDAHMIFRALEATTNGNLEPFLFSGAIRFLDYLQSLGPPMILLSLGDPSLQEIKVRGAGIHNYFDRMFFVHDSKENVLRELTASIDERMILLVNDKPDESRTLKDLFPSMKIILKKSASIPEAAYRQAGFTYANYIEEIQAYVEKYYS